MEKYFVLHKPIGDPAVGMAFFQKMAPGLAADMAAGKVPARALKTWNPIPFGRVDYVFCLWEADRIEDIEAVLADSGLATIVSADIMQVAEVDWQELALLAQ